MQTATSIPFNPEYSIQDNLEVLTVAKLQDRFPIFLETLIRCCAQVQEFAFELIKQQICAELQLRFKDAFLVKGEDEFELMGIRYRRAINLVDALGEGAIACRFRRTNAPEDKQKFSQKTKRWELSLTANSVQAWSEVTLKEFLPVVTDIVHRIIRATNGWLEERLGEMNKKAGSNALTGIRLLFKEEFGKLANDIMVYPYAETSGGYVGAYLMDETLFGTVVERIKKSAANSIPRAQQIAAMIESTMSIDLTESKHGLADKKSIVVTPVRRGRLYEFQYKQFHQGEDAYYGDEQIISHPMIFISDNITGAQLVVCYPLRFREMIVGGMTFPEKIEALRPKIKSVLKNNDLIAPILWFTRRFRNAGSHQTNDLKPAMGAAEIEIEEIKAEVFQGLSKFSGKWVPPDGDLATITQKLVEISSCIQKCVIIERLHAAKQISLGEPSLRTLAKLEEALHETK